MRHRREKLETLREKGVEPFAYNFEPSARCLEVATAFEEAEGEDTLSESGKGDTARVGGRIVAWRDMGRSIFAHLEDSSGRIQLYFKKNVLGEESFEMLGLLDLSD